MAVFCTLFGRVFFISLAASSHSLVNQQLYSFLSFKSSIHLNSSVKKIKSKTVPAKMDAQKMASKHVEVHCRPSQMAHSGCRDSKLCMLRAAR